MTIFNNKTQQRLRGLSVILLALFTIMFTVRRALAGGLATWIDRPDTSEVWKGLASDSTGQHLVGVNNHSGGDVFASDDYGATWHMVDGDMPGGTGTHLWTSIASSADGQTLVATENSGYIWTSTNRGAHWVAQENPSNYGSATISANGHYAAAVDTTHHNIFVATSSLNAWVQDNPWSTSWSAVAFSPDGNTLAAAPVSSGYLSVSTNQGSTWNNGLGGLVENWHAIVASNGGKIVAVGGYANIETLTSNGSSWHDSGFGNNHNWVTVAASTDGSSIIIGSNDPGGTPPVISTDSGSTWNNAPGLSRWDWETVTSNAAGTFMAAAGYSDVWTTPAGSPISLVNIASNNASTTLAKSGDVVTLTFVDTVTPAITPVVSIAGHATTTALNVDTNTWAASTTLTSSDMEGVVPFIAVVGNADATATTTVSATTNNSSVTLNHTTPVIVLQGSDTVVVSQGDSYNDAGAVVIDANHNSIMAEIVVTGSVNTSVPGRYTLTYNVHDANGNAAAPVTRTIIVLSHSSTSSSGGGAVSNQVLASILVPGTTTTAYLNSRHDSGVQNPPPVLTATSPSVSFDQKNIVFTKDLGLGAIDSQVRLLQQYLNTHGFVITSTGPGSPGNETSRFGRMTRAALIKFQKAHGISATGFFGPKTRALVNQSN